MSGDQVNRLRFGQRLGLPEQFAHIRKRQIWQPMQAEVLCDGRGIGKS
jgi:hypothetical protein